MVVTGVEKNIPAKTPIITFNGAHAKKGSTLNTSLKFIALFLLTQNLVGCSTLNDLRKSTNPESRGAPAASIVISKPGATTPIISSVDNATWIQLRDSKEAGKDRLNGLLATGAWQEATEEARRELEKSPGDVGALTALSAAYALGRNYEMAAYYGGVVLKTSPTNADAMNLVGLRLMMAATNRRTDFDEAIVMFKKALETDGTHVAAALNAGYLQLDLGDAPSAMESFTTAVRRCDNCFDAEYGLGLAAMRAGSWDQAKKTFEQALSRDKSRAAAQYQLAIVMHRGLNDPPKALSILQELVSDPDGRFKSGSAVKRAANITLRRWRASDRSGPIPEDITQPPTGDNSPD
jgi:tetratricopeptide (TPR) repeat protein